MAATDLHADVGESACKAGVVHRWGTDLTTTITGKGQAAVFVAVDHRSAERVGIHASLVVVASALVVEIRWAGEVAIGPAG